MNKDVDIGVEYRGNQKYVYLKNDGNINMLEQVARELGAGIADPHNIIYNKSLGLLSAIASGSRREYEETRGKYGELVQHYENEIKKDMEYYRKEIRPKGTAYEKTGLKSGVDFKQKLIDNYQNSIDRAAKAVEESGRNLSRAKQDKGFAIRKYLDPY